MKRADCDTNRNGDRSTGFEMFFLLRMAFWLGIVLVLLPTDKTPESEKLPQVAATDAVSAATAAMSDMAGFCTRQPAACDIGGQAATVMTHRAQAGAKKVYEFITEKKPPETTVVKEVVKDAPKEYGGRQDIRQTGSARDNGGKHAKKAPDHTGSIGHVNDADISVPADTLSADDLQLEWKPSVEYTPAL